MVKMDKNVMILIRVNVKQIFRVVKKTWRRMSSDHAQTGTRLLIETMDSDGTIKYKTVGGITEDNMDLEFSVNQIRNIT